MFLHFLINLLWGAAVGIIINALQDLYALFSIVEFAHPKRALALPSWTSLARLAAISSALVTWRLYNRAVAAAPLPTFAENPQKFPQTPGAIAHLRSGFAELFRSVCRNISGKLPSHAFAALTRLRIATPRQAGLCGVPPHELLASFIVLQNSE